MKIFKLNAAIFTAFLLVMTACEPIEIRQELENSFSPEQIDLTVVQATSGGNKLSIQMSTPGVIGYWDYIIDQKYTDRAEVVFPFTGTHEFTYHVTTPYMSNGNPAETEYVSRTVEVTVEQLDERLADEYYYLVGENLEGKTWVFDTENQEPYGQTVFWAMVAPYNWQELWWNAGECCAPADVIGSMTFDLAGGPNYTYKADASSDVSEVGTFNYGAVASGKMAISGTTVLGYDPDRVNPDGEYEIIELTADRLVLYTPTNGGGTGWVWVYKPAAN